MQIETLRLFCDLVEAGNFSTAAEKHHITQSAVSQRIAALEKEVGAKLLIRGRRAEATKEGRLFLKSAHQILEIHDDFRDQLRDFHEAVGGELKIATVYSIGLHELPPYLKWFRDHFPDVNVKVEYRRSNQVYLDVTEERADLGLVAYPEERRGISAETFWQDQLVAIFPVDHEFARRSTIAIQELQGSRFISFEPDLPTRKAIDAIFQDEHIVVDAIMELDNVEMVKRAVELESAVSIVPQRTVYAEVEGGRLGQALLEPSDLDTKRPLGMIWKKNRPMSPPLQEFLALLRTKRLF